MIASTRTLVLGTVASLVSAMAAAQPARTLTFEDRVRCQEQIERVYESYRHPGQPSAASLPRAALEAKVRNTLQLSWALAEIWNTPVEAATLDREIERMASRTRLPDRLLDLYAALDDDPFLVRECLARPVLVERLARDFFAADVQLHAAERAEAGRLRSRIAAGDAPDTARPSRTESVLAPPGGCAQALPRGNRDARWSECVDSSRFLDRRSRLPRHVGELTPVRESREYFHFAALLADAPDRFVSETYVVPKRGWDDWWQDERRRFDEFTVEPVASSLPLPVPEAGSSEIPPCGLGGTWQNGSLDDITDPRVNHSTVWTGSEMIVWGGRGLVPYLESGGRYDPATDTWSPLASTGAPSPRSRHRAVWTGQEMIVWGGEGPAGDLGDGARYDPATDAWLAVGANAAPSPRNSHSAVWTGQEILVWGGFAGATTAGGGGRYDPATDLWLPMGFDLDTPPYRGGHTAVWTGSEMIIWGGNDSAAVDSGGRYDPVQDDWLPMSSLLGLAARYGHTAVWTGQEMIVWGGSDASRVLADGAAYDPATNSWRFLGNTGSPSGRAFHSAVWTGTEMIVWGGASGTPHNSGGRYQPDTNTWQPTSVLSAPLPRQQHSAVWTGDRMVVWSGSGAGGLTTSGGRYDPATDGWTPTSSSAGRLPRRDHSAVWTGAEMIIWGGVGESSTHPILGERYDPATDSWSSTALAGAPSGREGHLAFWTGAEMLVWGGFDGTGHVSSGGRYDPLLDSWEPTATTGAPAPRASLAGAWTGSEMIIWGGVSGGTYRADGARYDPALDAWTPMSTVGAPAPRAHHSMAWTGQQAVVWGGESILGWLNTGALYDPLGDTWTPMSIAGAPEARGEHLSAWSGSELIVWGGQDTAGLLVSGGRYDPATDAWGATSLLGAPTGRLRGTAVWSGDRMLVWGGSDHSAFPYLQTGAGYDPVTDTWEEISSVDAPSARDRHSAVWFDGLMVIWGGTEFSLLNNGGRYLTIDSCDSDGDGVLDIQDNCPHVPNPGQENRDGDALGDACDPCPDVPLGLEICDGIDNDCDGVLPDDEADADGDGIRACDGDCDDDDPTIHPGSAEICNGVDEDCDGTVDDGNPGGGLVCGVTDVGACQLGLTLCAGGAVVCDGNIDPIEELPADGIDNDCDGLVDEPLLPVAVCSVFPSAFHVGSESRVFRFRIDELVDRGDPANPVPLEVTQITIAHISQAGSVVLPEPSTVPCPDATGSYLGETGIFEDLAARHLSSGNFELRFTMEADGDCRTMDGSRQEILALLADEIDGSTVPICFGSTIDGVAFQCCADANVRNTGNR